MVNKYLKELDGIVRGVVSMDQVRHISVEIRHGDAEVEISLKNADERTVNSFELADRIRDKVRGKIPGADVRVDAQSDLWMLRRLFGAGGEIQAALARSVIGGLLVSTMITLILIPVGYITFHRLVGRTEV